MAGSVGPTRAAPGRTDTAERTGDRSGASYAGCIVPPGRTMSTRFYARDGTAQALSIASRHIHGDSTQGDAEITQYKWVAVWCAKHVKRGRSSTRLRLCRVPHWIEYNP